MVPPMAGKRLLILGGGFGGLDVARAIGRSRGAREYWDTLLIDKENFFQFNPLLPAVAVGAVETRHIVYPLREMARHRHIRFFKNKVEHIDLERREVVLHNDLRSRFDTLIVALGSVTDYYGIQGAERYTMPFKNIVDAMRLRARVVELFEMAEQAESEAQRRRLLAFAIVGGGVTGVEVAAELIEMARETLLPRYPHLTASHITVTLLEGADRLVITAREEHSAYVRRFLERRGVKIRTSARVDRVEPRVVYLEGGERVEAFTILWTAGVRPPDVVCSLPVAHARDGRVRVDAHLHALDPGERPIAHVYVIGDCAASERGDGTLQPRLSQTAVAMGGYLGAALVREAAGRTIPAFGFRDAGYIISLGKHSSVVDLFGFAISGRLAWLLWAAAYLVKMVGLRKQLEVGIDHLTHLMFEHDSSQIMNRREVLTDEEIDLSLGSPAAEGGSGGGAGESTAAS